MLSQAKTRWVFRDFSPAGLLQFSLKVLTIREKNTKISASRSLKLSVLLSLAWFYALMKGVLCFMNSDVLKPAILPSMRQPGWRIFNTDIYAYH